MPTDLAGYLRDDEDNLTIRLVDWFAGVRTPPLSVNVRWRDAQATSPRRLNDDPIVVDPPDSRGIPNLIDAIEKLVIDRLGVTPIGTIRVQGYDKGQSAKSGLDFSSILLAPDSGGIGEPNLALVRGLYSQERQLTHQLISELRQSQHALTATVGALAQSLANSATIRTASSAASDTTGLGPLLAMGAVIVFAPHIKAAFGLNPDAPLTEVIKAARQGMNAAILDKKGGAPELVIPEHARKRRDALEVDAAPVLESDGAALELVDSFLARLANDPKARDRLLRSVAVDPVLAAEAGALYARKLAGEDLSVEPVQAVEVPEVPPVEAVEVPPKDPPPKPKIKK